MADELVATLTGAYGHPVVRTPNLDALVRQGCVSTPAYSPRPCAPRPVPAWSAASTPRPAARLRQLRPLRADIPSVGHYLTNAGYDCVVLSGKMHFVGPDPLHGFRRRLTTDIYAEEFNMLDNRSPWALARDPAAFSPGAGAWAPRRELRRLQRPRRALAPPPQLRRGGPLPRPGVISAPRGQSRGWREPLGGVRRPTPGREPGSAGEPGRTASRASWGRAAGRRGGRGRPPARLRRGGRPAPWFLCVSYHHPHEPFWPPQDVWDLTKGRRSPSPLPGKTWNLAYSAMDRWLNANHGVRHFQEELRSPESLYRVGGPTTP